jgi:hypothetical protein
MNAMQPRKIEITYQKKNSVHPTRAVRRIFLAKVVKHYAFELPRSGYYHRGMHPEDQERFVQAVCDALKQEVVVVIPGPGSPRFMIEYSGKINHLEIVRIIKRAARGARYNGERYL